MIECERFKYLQNDNCYLIICKTIISQPAKTAFILCQFILQTLALFGETKNPKESNFAERLIQTKILSLSVVAVAKRGQKKGRRGHNGVADGYQQPYYFHQGPYFYSV